MAKAKFDIPKIELKQIELPEGAKRPLYAGVGATDLAVEVVRDYVAEVQKRFVELQHDVQKTVDNIDLEPKALREQAATVVNARVTELQKDARELPGRVQGAVGENVATVSETYVDLVERGQRLVGRIRRQQSTKATVSSARTTTAKAKTTRTQASKSASSTAQTAKRSAGATKRTAANTSSTPRSSAKATATAAKKTAANATQAATDAAKKVGD